MGKVEAPRRTHSVYWRGSQYPYSTCHAASGLAQQARRPPAYNHGSNGIPRLSAAIGGRVNGVDNILHSLSERMHASSTRLSRTVSLSSSSSGSATLGSPMGSPQMSQMACFEEEKPLKRLAFIRSQGSFWLTWMSAAYTTGRALVPLPHGVINALETTMSDLGGSLISAASQQSEKVLYALDAKVDSVMSMTSEAQDGCAGGGEVWWGSLSQRPPIKYVVSAYQQAHDAVVATSIYTKAMELGSETMSKVHDSRLYKSLLPLVGPLTEPTVKRILESPTFQAVKEHLAPMPPPEDVNHQMPPQLLAA
jgi:hypothetical protein